MNAAMPTARNTIEQANSVAQTFTMPARLSDALNAWIERQPAPRPSRSEAVLRLLSDALAGASDAGSISAADLNASNDE
jgi:hypothetical protein